MPIPISVNLQPKLHYFAAQIEHTISGDTIQILKGIPAADKQAATDAMIKLCDDIGRLTWRDNSFVIKIDTHSN